MEVAENTHHLDPYEIHQENMHRLKVISSLTNNASHSAPNSPMMRRAIQEEKLEGKQNNLLSPMPQRKDIKMTADNRSRSLTHLAKSDGTRSRSLSPSPRTLSPGESPIGSPMSVSDRIIRTHFLSNTTGKPGSYLLKKSDNIIKQKGSPTGSPQMMASPSIDRRHPSPNIIRKLPPLTNKDSAGLTTQIKLPAAIVISPAIEEGIDNTKVSPKRLDPLSSVSPKKQISNMKPIEVQQNKDLSSIKAVRQMQVTKDVAPLPISDMRKSIGDVLLKPKLTETATEPNNAQSFKNNMQEKSELQKINAKSNSKQDLKLKKHRYMKYGNTKKSPGLLSPPTEPRGSKDLSAEMENMYKRERRVFDDLDHLEEVSVGTSDEDHGEHLSISAEELRASSAKNSTQVFTMPPVFDNVPAQLQVRDYSVPVSIGDLEVDEEEWENMKQCRYLRMGENAGAEDEDEEELTFSDVEDESGEEEEDQV